MAYYRASTVEDCYELAPKLREADAREVMASGGFTPLDALVESFKLSEETNSIIHNDEVIGMFGCGSCEHTGGGVPWMLASDKITDISRQFLRESRKWIEKVQDEYPLLYNYVSAENEIAITWLSFLGFKFIREVEDYMGGGLTFIEFVRIKNV